MIEYNLYGQLHEITPQKGYLKNWYAGWHAERYDKKKDLEGRAGLFTGYHVTFVGKLKDNNCYPYFNTTCLVPNDTDIFINLAFKGVSSEKTRWFL